MDINPTDENHAAISYRRRPMSDDDRTVESLSEVHDKCCGVLASIDTATAYETPTDR